MKKIFKTLTVAILAIAAVFACAFTATACKKTDYAFSVVYEDGKAVNGQKDGDGDNGLVRVQICEPDKLCYPFHNKYPIGEDGKLTLTQSQVNEILGSDSDVKVFVIHVLGVTGHKQDCELTVNGPGNYTVKITK